jgi:Tfp pilus assembly protein PilV
VALLVFAIGLLATLYYWRNLRQGVEADLQSAYTHQAQVVVDDMSSRIRSYQNFLSGSAGLITKITKITKPQTETEHNP